MSSRTEGISDHQKRIIPFYIMTNPLQQAINFYLTKVTVSLDQLDL